MLLITNIFLGWAHAEELIPPAGIKTVAIIRVPQPLEIVSMDRGSIGFAFGAVGATAVLLDAYTNQKGLVGAIARTQFSFSNQLTQDFNEALAAHGYKTLLVDADRKGRPDKLLDDYSTIQTEGADAILDVSLLTVGYATEHFMFSPHWRPDVSVFAALTPRTATQPLYKERIMYGLHNPLMSAAKLNAPKEFQFANREAMDGADDATLIGGLKDASKAIAAHVSNKMQSMSVQNAAP
ncbi:MAG: hypothetical protein ACYC4K_05405 [Thiobacillus sp.]